MIKLSPGRQIGPYTLIKRLGGGQFSDVWLGERRGRFATTQVALKIIHEELQDQEEIARESQLWAQIGTHPNILPIIESDIYDDLPVIVTEYAPDGSLEDWLDKHGGMAPSIDAAISMALGIISGLAHLHLKKIVHRDLKPANIMLTGDIPRLTDFGVSRQLKATDSARSIAGTPAYMAPEMFDGKRSEQADIWSAGVLFYKMLCGKLPFPQNGVALIYAVSIMEPDPLPKTIPLVLRQVVICALKKDPTERYSSGIEMKAALEAAQKEMIKSELQNSIAAIPNTKQNLRPVPWIPVSSSNVKTGSFRTLPNLSEFQFKTLSLDKSGTAFSASEKKSRQFIEVLSENVRLEMVEIPAGTFFMGSNQNNDKNSLAWEEPYHLVTLPSFYISKYPVTQAQWQAVMNTNPSFFQQFPNVNLPVEQVSWYDAVEFCHRLSVKTGRAYRLPSESQWEYAARAGTTTAFAFGEVITTDIVNFNGNYSVISTDRGIYRKQTTNVGELGFANNFGLYDIHGNVWEWCQDVYHENYNGAPINGNAWEQGGDQTRRILRGGAWISSSLMCRSAFRETSVPDKASNAIGFRLIAIL